MKFLKKVFLAYLRIIQAKKRKRNINLSQKVKLLVYPQISKREKLIEIVQKIAWAYPKKENLEIHIHISTKLLEETLKLDFITSTQNSAIQSFEHIVFRSDVKGEFYDYHLCHDIGSFQWILKNPCKLEIIDKHFYSTVESTFFQSAFNKILSNEQNDYYKNISKTNFERLQKALAGKKSSTCFVTGPSFNTYKDLNLNLESIKIICNSIVKNEEFLNYIKGPDILVFADPVFHYGANDYSIAFRNQMTKTFLKHKPFIIVPNNTLGLLIAHYPFLIEKIIGLNTIKGKANIPSPNNLWVENTSNILTLLMLPVASSLSNEIAIVGADGRDKSETYFWKHSKESQFDDLIPSVFNFHPSFFRDRNYLKYYKKHCRVLKNQILFLESKGKKITSLTNSNIPILKERKQKGNSNEC